jgi:hypothetical protein
MTPSASACGGFFCAQSAPVNQAAERIVFADNGDGTVTAVIQILYEGPSESFSWLLPISSVPEGDEIAVASDIAFARLQNATNPTYTLTTTVEGTCKDGGPRGAVPSGGNNTGGPTLSPDPGTGVTVEASGVVGSFEWTVISFDQSLAEPAAAAVEWLGTNGYDIPPGAPALIGPYLQEGLYLLALKLVKGADAGSIRPIVLTYDGTRPSIPIKLTQVAANDDMGVLTWVLGSARAVPQNYLALELNEARINWFNPSSNYNEVVIAAANDTGTGQGFVTEYAQATGVLGKVVFGPSDEQFWENFRTSTTLDTDSLFFDAYYQWGAWDGFWDAVRASGTLRDDMSWEEFEAYPQSFPGALALSAATFLSELEAGVIEPVRLVQRLLDSQPQVTRLYTTLSAAEMTVDPLFTFNPDLQPVSNLHTGERVIECSPEYTQNEAPWRILLPQGDLVRGSGLPPGGRPSWPLALADQPPNRVIRQQGETGEGRVLEDNSETISSLLATHNESTLPPKSRSSSGCSVGPVAPGGVGGAAWLGLGLLVAGLGLRRQIWPNRG